MKDNKGDREQKIWSVWKSTHINTYIQYIRHMRKPENEQKKPNTHTHTKEKVCQNDLFIPDKLN